MVTQSHSCGMFNMTGLSTCAGSYCLQTTTHVCCCVLCLLCCPAPPPPHTQHIQSIVPYTTRLCPHPGQPVLIGGTMGTCSYVLTGTDKGLEETFGSTCHGAGEGTAGGGAVCAPATCSSLHTARRAPVICPRKYCDTCGTWLLFGDVPDALTHTHTRRGFGLHSRHLATPVCACVCTGVLTVRIHLVLCLLKCCTGCV